MEGIREKGDVWLGKKEDTQLGEGRRAAGRDYIVASAASPREKLSSHPDA